MVWTSATLVPGASVALLALRAKTVPDKATELFGILEDVLTNSRLDDRERFWQLVLENKASLEAGLVPGGSAFVNLRLQANLHEAYWASEQMSGISQLFFLRNLARQIETDWEAVLSDSIRNRGPGPLAGTILPVAMTRRVSCAATGVGIALCSPSNLAQPQFSPVATTKVVRNWLLAPRALSD